MNVNKICLSNDLKLKAKCYYNFITDFKCFLQIGIIR